MARKIIQISTTSENEHSYEKVVALCDDGTLWSLATARYASEWERIEDIPQDEEVIITGMSLDAEAMISDKEVTA